MTVNSRRCSPCAAAQRFASCHNLTGSRPVLPETPAIVTAWEPDHRPAPSPLDQHGNHPCDQGRNPGTRPPGPPAGPPLCPNPKIKIHYAGVCCQQSDPCFGARMHFFRPGRPSSTCHAITFQLEGLLSRGLVKAEVRRPAGSVQPMSWLWPWARGRWGKSTAGAGGRRNRWRLRPW